MKTKAKLLWAISIALLLVLAFSSAAVADSIWVGQTQIHLCWYTGYGGITLMPFTSYSQAKTWYTPGDNSAYIYHHYGGTTVYNRWNYPFWFTILTPSFTYNDSWIPSGWNTVPSWCDYSNECLFFENWATNTMVTPISAFARNFIWTGNETIPNIHYDDIDYEFP